LPVPHSSLCLYCLYRHLNPDDLKIEGRIELIGTPEDWQTQLTAWEDLGADLVSIGTARAHYNTPDEHIQAIKTFKDII